MMFITMGHKPTYNWGEPHIVPPSIEMISGHTLGSLQGMPPFWDQTIYTYTIYTDTESTGAFTIVDG